MDNFTNLRTFLERFVARFNPALAKYLQNKKAELAKHDSVETDLVEEIRQIAEGGGKRIRPALVDLGFRVASGKTESDDILSPAIGMELLHVFFLIHDDIMDRSETRRNQPTVHRNIRTRYHDLLQGPGMDAEHFSHSMAILVGDLCCAIAYEALTSSNFPPNLIVKATQCLHAMINATVSGQVLDMVEPLRGKSDEDVVERIHLLKTAKYTLEGPLHLGLVLGGATSQLLTHIAEYAIPVGIAFQIQDDILGLFGTEEELGKSVTSDIQEGKQTLMTAFVFQNGTPAEKKRLGQVLGKSDVSLNDLGDIQNIITESGALRYAEGKARRYAQTGKAALKNVPFPKREEAILEELADFVVHRNT